MKSSTKPECGLCGQYFQTDDDFDAHRCQVALRQIEADIARMLDQRD